MKKKDNVSEKLVEYIKQNNISIEQISKDTGVSYGIGIFGIMFLFECVTGIV